MFLGGSSRAAHRADPPVPLRFVGGSPLEQGRFPSNGIISLLDVSRRLNLGESTTRDLTFGELVDIVGADRLRGLRLGYGSAQGEADFRDAIAERTGVSPDSIITTQGTALGIALLALQLCVDGGDALVFSPHFPPSRDLLIGLGVSVRDMELDFARRFEVDLNRFAADLTPATVLVSIASPQNPTGVVTPVETLMAMLALMKSRAPKAHLFVDETYLDATYGETTLASAASLDQRVIVGGSVSKAHGAPGLRAGWLTVQDHQLRSRLMIAKMNLIISGSPLNEVVAAALLRRSDLQSPRRQFLSDALASVESWAEANSHLIAWVRPDAGALCVMRLRPDRFDDRSVEKFWSALPTHDLQLAPGSWFGATDREFRLGFGYLSLEILREALGTLALVLTRSAEGR